MFKRKENRDLELQILADNVGWWALLNHKSEGAKDIVVLWGNAVQDLSGGQAMYKMILVILAVETKLYFNDLFQRKLTGEWSKESLEARPHITSPVSLRAAAYKAVRAQRRMSGRERIWMIYSRVISSQQITLLLESSGDCWPKLFFWFWVSQCCSSQQQPRTQGKFAKFGQSRNQIIRYCSGHCRFLESLGSPMRGRVMVVNSMK